MENMTDKQLEVIMNLVADKFDACKDMEEVKKAIKEVREMAKKEKVFEGCLYDIPDELLEADFASWEVNENKIGLNIN